MYCLGTVSSRRQRPAKPTRRHADLTGLSQLIGQGNTLVWREGHCVPTGDGGEALVHRWKFPSTRRRGDDSGRRRGNEKATDGIKVDCLGGS